MYCTQNGCAQRWYGRKRATAQFTDNKALSVRTKDAHIVAYNKRQAKTRFADKKTRTVRTTDTHSVAYSKGRATTQFTDPKTCTVRTTEAHAACSKRQQTDGLLIRKHVLYAQQIRAALHKADGRQHSLSIRKQVPYAKRMRTRCTL